MALSKTISVRSATPTQQIVSAAHFGGNTLHRVNVSTEGEVLPNFAESAAALGLTDLRYPGGLMEDYGDLLTGGTDQQLAPHLVTFLDWVRQQNTVENQYTVTLGIPTKNLASKGYDTASYAQKVYDFARLIAQDYSDVVKAIEIGNEYSIGSEWLSETAYGNWANIAASALADGFQAAGVHGAAQPKILIQMAEIFGHGSDYSGTGDHVAANAAIITELEKPAIKAIDGVVQHYYYKKDHDGSDDFASSENFSEDYKETRFLSKKIDAWEQQWQQVSNRDLDLVFTEWSVQKDNVDQLGLKAAGTLLKQFEFMLQLGVDAAHIWPIQHKTKNSLAGNPAEGADLTPAGGLFHMLSQNFTDAQASGPTRLLEVEFGQKLTSLETVAFRQDYKTTLYISSRSAQTTNISLDLRNIASDITAVSAVILGYDPSSSDGLSEMGDANHKNRVAKRKISYLEYQQLKSLAFFDETKGAHITIKENSNGDAEYLTYLPQFDDIIPLTSAPTTIEDYYFATEVDVNASYEYLSFSELGAVDNISFELDPFEVIELRIDHSKQQASAAGAATTLGIAALPSTPGTIKIDSSVFAWSSSHGHLWTKEEFEDTEVIGATSELKDEVVHGDATANRIQSEAGDDQLFGGAGDDILISSVGNDYVAGGAGDDRIDAGAGSDTIEGGPGADFFVFRNFDGNDHDVIRDFDADEDVLVLAGVSSGDQLGRFKNITITETTSGGEIEYGDYRLQILGPDGAQLTLDEIIFI